MAEFIRTALDRFDVGVWTASGEKYAAQVIDRVFPAAALKFVWSSQRCTLARNWITGEYETIKNLSKLQKRGRHAVKVRAELWKSCAVREFLGDRKDNELPLLLRYLETLRPVENVRSH